MSLAKPEQELINIPMTVDVPYRFAAGKYLGRFLTELRDNGRLLAIKCPKCGRVQMPPRVVCAVCHVKSEDWVELGLEGTLAAYTIMYLPLTDPTTGKPHDPPFVYGSVKLDGADSVLDHLIDIEPDPAKLKVGMRMRVVLRPREQRVGDLSDILHLTLAEDPEQQGENP
ncbi:MAG: Zn-ribbon domain-containing OB-fold protein [Pseudomonadota bacterium]